MFFCLGCQKHKMLFESKAKADNFIRYNSEGILEENGKAPVRSYYCELCGGYHVTSNPSDEIGEMLNKRDHLRIEKIYAYKEEIEIVKSVSGNLSKRLDKIRTLLFFGDSDTAEELMEICQLDLDELSSHNMRGTGKFTTQQRKVEKMYNMLRSVKGLYNISEKEQEDILSYTGVEHEKIIIRKIFHNVIIHKKILSLLSENESSFMHGNIEDIEKRLEEVKILFSGMSQKKAKNSFGKSRALAQNQKLRLNALKKRHDTSTETTEAVNQNKETHYQETTDYKEKVLALIDCIKSIENAFNEGDYETCEISIEKGYYMLYELNVNDKNTELLERHLDKWSKQLEELRQASQSPC